jgi:hypothetical protein
MAKTRFVSPIMYAPVLGVTGNYPPVSTSRVLSKEVAKTFTGLIAVN